MRRSLVKEKLQRDEYVVLTQVWTVPHWKIVEIMGLIGFDGVWIEHEHSDFSYGDLSQMILAARAHDMDSLIRVERTGYNGTLKALEAGATGIIAPHCLGAEDARAIVRDAKYDPVGFRGCGGSVDADYGLVDRSAYYANTLQETLVIAIIEDKEAVDEIDGIAATEGIDALLLGPGDLSQSYGLLGQLDHELVHAARDAMAQACARHGKAWGAPVGSRDDVKRLLDKGGRLVQLANEQAALVSGLTQMKEMAEGL
ncbi:MAG: hypothetical protein CMJ18_15180 [Phycisphaeraceae bacterium]|nr:hypothetical protein [Phycisphaeraceae bacterium]